VDFSNNIQVEAISLTLIRSTIENISDSQDDTEHLHEVLVFLNDLITSYDLFVELLGSHQAFRELLFELPNTKAAL
jgi:hypothetical protein